MDLTCTYDVVDDGKSMCLKWVMRKTTLDKEEMNLYATISRHRRKTIWNGRRRLPWSKRKPNHIPPERKGSTKIGTYR